MNQYTHIGNLIFVLNEQKKPNFCLVTKTCAQNKGCGERCYRPNRWLYDIFYPEYWPRCHSYMKYAKKNKRKPVLLTKIK